MVEKVGMVELVELVEMVEMVETYLQNRYTKTQMKKGK